MPPTRPPRRVDPSDLARSRCTRDPQSRPRTFRKFSRRLRIQGQRMTARTAASSDSGSPVFGSRHFGPIAPSTSRRAPPATSTRDREPWVAHSTHSQPRRPGSPPPPLHQRRGQPPLRPFATPSQLAKIDHTPGAELAPAAPVARSRRQWFNRSVTRQTRTSVRSRICSTAATTLPASICLASSPRSGGRAGASELDDLLRGKETRARARALRALRVVRPRGRRRSGGTQAAPARGCAA